tara:strand:+ start:1101 stop:1898 length:798 start_codon:yes stop_codon:yes gene_type:complete
LEFRVKKKTRNTNFQVAKEDFNVARKFAKEIYDEFQNFISVITVFGSTVTKKKNNDIDMLVILDDVRIVLEDELIQTYRVIVEKTILDVDARIHVQTMRLTTFWEYIRSGDPVAVNILRTSISLVDSGFFDPLQALLDGGRIRPSQEAVYTYFTMAPKTLFKARDHVLTGMMDLYWACIDASHAALMAMGEIPPNPAKVPEMLDKILVKKNYLKKSHVKTVQDLYNISKKITNRQIREVTGKDFERYYSQAKEYVDAIQRIIEKL